VVTGFCLWSILAQKRATRKDMVSNGSERGRYDGFPVISGPIRGTFGER
jgi:hypothetical protein